MRAGRLRHRIVCDQPVTSQQANGEQQTTFVEAFESWASIEPLNGREQLRSDQILAEIDTRIRIRWSAKAERINATWRLRHKDTIYNISAPPSHINMGRREIQILCKSGLNQG